MLTFARVARDESVTVPATVIFFWQSAGSTAIEKDNTIAILNALKAFFKAIIK